jgi:hypothetical protein
VITNSEAKGIKLYLERLTHPVKGFNFKFTDVEYEIRGDGKLKLEYDVNVQSKVKDLSWLWDYFNCKSKHIVEDACDIVGVSFGHVLPVAKYIYVDDFESQRYGGYLSDSFVEKVTNDITQKSPKQITTHFFCGGERKNLVLNVTYDVSNIYIDDGIQTDVSVYCSEVLVDGEPLENITQNLAETIVGYVSEDDNLRFPLDSSIWDEITKYMDLGSCEIWTHTYTFIRNIGDIQIDDFNFTNQSTFSSKLCDFISGDY